MTVEAKEKAKGLRFDLVELRVSDITDLSLADGRVGVSVCIRLLNWFDFLLFQKAIRELRRVTSEYIIAGVRLASGQRHLADRIWLEEVVKRGTQNLKALARNARHPLDWLGGTAPSSDQVFSGPSLVDHPEEKVRQEFRRLDLSFEEEIQALTFKSAPRLRDFGAVKELPYCIFLLRV